MHRKTYSDPERKKEYSQGFITGRHARRRSRMSLAARFALAVIIPLALVFG